MLKNLKILLVEDDANLGLLLSEYLKAKGYPVTLKQDGNQGYEEYIRGDYNFLILDVMVPEKDGFTLAREIREIDEAIPILFLTAKSMKEDKLEGFKAGGDDYVTKPFSMEELLARIQAILKRAGQRDDSDVGPFTIGKFVFDPENRLLKDSNVEVKLTTKENDLLKLLNKNSNSILDRNYALKKIWGDDSYFNGRSMDVYITKLRKHLKPD
ncbi:MAG: DNA-binding response regulator, partial [Bacteroidetes bacterium]